jgi:hypothetical protein
MTQCQFLVAPIQGLAILLLRFSSRTSLNSSVIGTGRWTLGEIPMKKSLVFGACLVIVLVAASSFAQTPLNSSEAKRMEKRVEKREALVQGWASEAKQQVVLSLMVGILGLAVGALQKPTQKWARVLSVAVGFSVSVITLCTNKLYPADYQTLQRAVDEASPVIEELEDYPYKYETAEEHNQDKDKLQISVDFAAACGRIDEISHRMLGANGPSDRQAGNGQKQTSSIFAIDAVHAQSSPPANGIPTWVQSHAQSHGSVTYFVGVGRDATLSTAKSLALRSASYQRRILDTTESSQTGKKRPSATTSGHRATGVTNRQ